MKGFPTKFELCRPDFYFGAEHDHYDASNHEPRHTTFSDGSQCPSEFTLTTLFPNLKIDSIEKRTDVTLPQHVERGQVMLGKHTVERTMGIVFNVG